MEWRYRRVSTVAPVTLALIALAGCGDQRLDNDLAAPSPDELRQVLVGRAASSLDQQGRFLLSQGGSPDEELSQAEARALASAYLTAAGPSFSRTLSKDRGSAVDAKSLRQCGAPLYAASPFEPITGDIPGFLKRTYGSWWLVGFCGKGGSIEVSVAVSALATELSVQNGKINFGESDGNEFFTLGVPPEWDSPVGLSPERAAMRMSHRTGRRVNEVPALIASDPRVAYPQGALWRVGLESSVRVHGDKSKRVVDVGTVFAGLQQDVGKKPRSVADDAAILRVPAEDQPAEFRTEFSYYNKGARLNDKPVSREATIRRRADTPIVFETASTEEP